MSVDLAYPQPEIRAPKALSESESAHLLTRRIEEHVKGGGLHVNGSVPKQEGAATGTIPK
ncbi:MAG TPA: hypothetical protein VFQ43_12320 [Nitrososphaera sp.]|nr:hypothetical protein [Nitrososphaera sp.]